MPEPTHWARGIPEAISKELLERLTFGILAAAPRAPDYAVAEVSVLITSEADTVEKFGPAAAADKLLPYLKMLPVQGFATPEGSGEPEASERWRWKGTIPVLVVRRYNISGDSWDYRVYVKVYL